MLVDVEVGQTDPRTATVLGMIGKGRSTGRLMEGVYQNSHWGFELEFRGRQVYEKDYPDLSEFPCYGVCDSPEQLVEALPEIVTKGPKKYVISMVNLKKSDEPEEGGWRWHKWGQYIGKQEPKCEYLAHEPKIEEVWTFHIYEV